MLSEVYGLVKKDFLELEKYQAWVRILNHNSLVITYPPPVPEIEITLPEFGENIEKNNLTPQESNDIIDSTHKCNFLKECWFTC